MKYQASSFLLFLHLSIASLGLAVGQEQQDETDELYLSSENPGLREHTEKFQEFNDFESDHHRDLQEMVVLPQDETLLLDDEDEDEVVGYVSSSSGFKDFVGYHHQGKERSQGSARTFNDFELHRHLPKADSLSLEDEDELVDADASSSGFEDFAGYNDGGHERGRQSLVRSARILQKKNNNRKNNKNNNNVAAPTAPKIKKGAGKVKKGAIIRMRK